MRNSGSRAQLGPTRRISIAIVRPTITTTAGAGRATPARHRSGGHPGLDVGEEPMMMHRSWSTGAVAMLAALSWAGRELRACTGITLKAADGAVVYGRTLEWGSFDLGSRLTIIPRGHAFAGQHARRSSPGSVAGPVRGGGDGRRREGHRRGRDEREGTGGRAVLPSGVRRVPEAYDPAEAARTMAPTDVGQYLLTTCARRTRPARRCPRSASCP